MNNVNGANMELANTFLKVGNVILFDLSNFTGATLTNGSAAANDVVNINAWTGSRTVSLVGGARGSRCTPTTMAALRFPIAC